MPSPRFTPEPPIYTFRVRILGCGMGYAPENATEIQREIEIASNHTLGDLGFAILKAFNFDSDHLFSFFLSGRAWDKKTEYAFHAYDDAFENMAEEFPEGSEMRKVAELAEDPNIDPTAPLPPEIDQDKLRGEIVDLFRAAVTDAPVADRAALEEFAQLVATTPDFDPAMMSDALQQLLVGAPPDPSDVPMLFPGLDPGNLPDLFAFDDEEAPDVDEILIRDVPFPGKTGRKEFLFLFDYGDEWEFGVKLLGTSDRKTPRARYPRVTAKRGKAPPQYPSWDDEDDEDWDEEEWEDEEGDIPHATVFRTDPKTGTLIVESIIITPPKKPASS
jgi:hypothetical protein